MANRQTKSAPMHFKTMMQLDVPQGRNGKHKLIITTMVRDLDNLKAGSALKIPLAELAESKEKVRSAPVRSRQRWRYRRAWSSIRSRLPRCR